MDSAQQSTPANALDQRTCVLPEAVRVLQLVAGFGGIWRGLI
jgi:hypothetical protein